MFGCEVCLDVCLCVYVSVFVVSLHKSPEFHSLSTPPLNPRLLVFLLYLTWKSDSPFTVTLSIVNETIQDILVS
jgi:hypothetical protein